MKERFDISVVNFAEQWCYAFDISHTLYYCEKNRKHVCIET